MKRERAREAMPQQVVGNPLLARQVVPFPPRLTYKGASPPGPSPLKYVTLEQALAEEEAQRILAKEDGNKYHAKRTWSNLCGRVFASKAEAVRGEELAMLEKAGEIRKLAYQPRYVLSDSPRVTYVADFSYVLCASHGKNATVVVEDVKGRDTPNSRTKRAWVKQRYGIEVKLVRKGEA